MTLRLQEGAPDRLGAVATEDGVNFAVFSAHATRIELCLFDEAGEHRFDLPARTGDIWHGFAPGLKPGHSYGFRAHGPWDPGHGHLFNPAKLLIDPYARALSGRVVWHPSMTGYAGLSPAEGGPSKIDSAPFVPKSLVVADAPARRAPGHAPGLIYEAHVKGLTQRHPGVAPKLRGTYAGLTEPAVIDHLQSLGVTHIELLPVTAFIDDRHVRERNLVNYWGYQPIAQLAPEPRYGAGFAEMVARFADAGIGVILDVVYNHSGEGDVAGPTLSYRGLDNRSYYRLRPDGGNVNDTGCGNTLNVAHPMVTRLILDSLRNWASMGVAGFRYDLAVTLLRGGAHFLDALLADPVLKDLIQIAEPWDLGPDGYRLGRFPAPFREWNDRYRDDLRRYWRGDGRPGDLARRLAGSAEIFDSYGRGAGASVNYLTAHDGFTLQDVVSYRGKHNHGNGEDNHDGHHENLSDNMGAEGPSAALKAVRDRRKRAMLASLFLSQGTPMLLAGDELGQSQRGNNNAYAQDNELTWIDWPKADRGLQAFVAKLSALRRRFPALRQERFLHGDFDEDGVRDLVWLLADGRAPEPHDWDMHGQWPIGALLATRDETIYAVFNAGAAAKVLLPEGPWLWHLDSSAPERAEAPVSGLVEVSGQSVQLFSQAGASGVERQ